LFEHRDKNGVCRIKRDTADFRGTSTYASPHAHYREDLCPRDDLYGVFFVFIDLLCGWLPWTDASRNKDKNSVTQAKTDFLAHPTIFLEWALQAALLAHQSIVRNMFSVHCNYI
jgi:hypothetical protein